MSDVYAATKSTCQGSHIVGDVMKDVAKLKSELAETKTQVSNHLNEAVAKYTFESWWQNSSCLQKLRSNMLTDTLQHLVSSKEAVGSSSIKKVLNKAVDEAKEKTQEAGRGLASSQPSDCHFKHIGIV